MNPLRVGASTPTILVVDDEEPVRNLACRILEMAGYHVCEATDGTAAVNVLTSIAVDLVVADIQMPRMDGRELGLRLSRQWPSLPILFISGYDQSAGASLPGPLLPKPFSFEQLTSEVRRLLVRRQRSA